MRKWYISSGYRPCTWLQFKMYIFPLKNLDNFTPLAHYVHFSMIWFIKKDKIERLNLYRDRIITSTYLLFSLRMLFMFTMWEQFSDWIHDQLEYQTYYNLDHYQKKISLSLNKNFKHFAQHVWFPSYLIVRLWTTNSWDTEKCCRKCKIINILGSVCLKYYWNHNSYLHLFALIHTNMIW